VGLGIAPQGQNDLTIAESKILELVSAGLENREIAVRLSIKECTVKKCVHLILDKLCVKNRTQATLLWWGVPYKKQLGSEVSKDG
jgi:DNA-binding NarL/FixJ family response regulator